jgi:uncharacterized RDD family membrane protein YckC
VVVPTSPGGYPLAEFTDRLVARLIDGAILGAVSLIFVVPIYLVVFLSVMPTTTVVNGDPDRPRRRSSRCSGRCSGRPRSCWSSG